MNIAVVRSLIPKIREALEQERARELLDARLEGHDVKISARLMRAARKSKADQIRAARKNSHIKAVMSRQKSDAERAVELALDKQGKENRTANILEGTIVKLEGWIVRNDKKLVVHSRKILGLIAGQETALGTYVQRIQNHSAWRAALDTFDKLEGKKETLFAEKQSLLERTILWRRRVIHDRGLIIDVKGREKETIKLLRPKFGEEAKVAERQRITKDDQELENVA